MSYLFWALAEMKKALTEERKRIGVQLDALEGMKDRV